MAIISGIAPPTRSRYINGWDRWVVFAEGQQRPPWISREIANWGDLLIDFILFVAKIMGNAAPTIRGYQKSGFGMWRRVVMISTPADGVSIKSREVSRANANPIARDHLPTTRPSGCIMNFCGSPPSQKHGAKSCVLSYKAFSV